MPIRSNKKNSPEDLYRWGKRRAQRVLRQQGLVAAEQFVRRCKESWERSGSILDKKAYDGARKIALSGPSPGGYTLPEGDIDVLMITQNDWANTGYRFSKSLEALGLNVVFIKGSTHPYNYPAQAPIDPALSIAHCNVFPWVVRPTGLGAKRIKNLMNKAKVIHFIASTYIDVGIDLSDKLVVVQHGGTTYRQRPKASNNIFNKFVDATIIQCPDLLSLGSKNEHLIYYPVQTDLIVPNYERRSSKILIGHFPSNPKNKGTRDILRVVGQLEEDPKLRGRFEYIGTKETRKNGDLPWREHLERMAECDILIETLNMNQNKKKFGEWGNTAIEAAALGKIVVTNSQTRHIYKKEYGDCALNIANTKSQLESTLKRLLALSDEQVMEEKKKTRAWVVENHSMQANSKRLWEKIYCKFFPELEDQIRSKF